MGFIVSGVLDYAAQRQQPTTSEKKGDLPTASSPQTRATNTAAALQDTLQQPMSYANALASHCRGESSSKRSQSAPCLVGPNDNYCEASFLKVSLLCFPVQLGIGVGLWFESLSSRKKLPWYRFFGTQYAHTRHEQTNQTNHMESRLIPDKGWGRLPPRHPIDSHRNGFTLPSSARSYSFLLPG
eukprot:6045940-Amphidinium_carterae.1